MGTSAIEFRRRAKRASRVQVRMQPRKRIDERARAEVMSTGALTAEGQVRAVDTHCKWQASGVSVNPAPTTSVMIYDLI